VSVPINARFRTRELRYVIPHSEVKVLCTSDLTADQADHPTRLVEAFPSLSDAGNPRNLHIDGAPRLRAVALLGSGRRPGFVGRDDFEVGASEVPMTKVDRLGALASSGDLAAILYTSGTTANPKGCLHSQASLVRNGVATGQSRFMLTPDDRFWDPLPMFHVASLIPLIATIDSGAAFLSTTHFDARSALDQIESEHATWLFPAFPAIASAILDAPSFPDRDLTSVRMTMCTGPEALLRRLQTSLPHTTQISAYGSTETAGVIAYHLPTDEADVRATTCGLPLPGIDVDVAGPDGARLPAGEIGQILVRGYSITDGYYKDPRATSAAIDNDGWFRTGDLGRLDADGHLTYIGRSKEMLKIGGENVAPLEIESALSDHPAIQMVQAVGAPDPRLDEVVALFIELRPGSALAEAEVIAFCRARLASFKVPRYVRFVSEWPMSATKIQKNILAERIAAELRPRRPGTAPIHTAQPPESDVPGAGNTT
jgi:fatty-acyl-CoA synthase